MQPDLRHARQTAVTAHSVVIKLKEMGLPEDYDGELALLSTDLGDLWSAQRELADRLDGLVAAPDDWGARWETPSWTCGQPSTTSVGTWTASASP